jgi:hypothetical protein
MRASCPAHRILLDLIILIILVKRTNFLSLRSKYSQHPVSKHSQSMFVRDPSTERRVELYLCVFQSLRFQIEDGKIKCSEVNSIPHSPYLVCVSVSIETCIYTPVPVAAQSKCVSWTVRTLGSWIGIPLEAWMYARVFLYCAVQCR